MEKAFFMKAKSLLLLLVFAVGVLTLSSCNRGYGCPTNVKAELTQAMHVAVSQAVGQVK